MQISTRFRQCLDTPSASLADAALAELGNGDVKPLVDLLESFFRPMPIRAVKFSNKDTLRTTLESFWFRPNEHHCVAEMCLLADPKAKYGDGRYRFVDIFIPGSPHVPCLELKSASLVGLWRGEGGQDDGRADQLQQLQEKLNGEAEAELLRRKVKYRGDGGNGWYEKTINEMKESGFQQIKGYLDIIKRGKTDGQHPGVLDSRICCGQGSSDLHGYLVICIGATRVLAWQVSDQQSDYLFEAIK